MTPLTASVVVAASPARVWDVMSDVERWHEWTPTVTSIRRVNGGPLGIGARARIDQPRLPSATWVVTAFTDGRSFDWEMRRPAVRVVAGHLVEPHADGARVTLTLQYHGPIGILVGRLLSSLSRRYMALEADGLKRRAEASAFHA